MPLTRGEVLTTVKNLLRASSTLNLSYTTAELNGYFYDALKYAVLESRWPQTKQNATWPANAKEVIIPDGVIEILRVYVNGQRIPPTSIPLLEDDVGREYNAEWSVADGVTIPALSSSSDTALTVLGDPDVRYYIRGRVIGLYKYPTAAYTISIHGLYEPNEPAADNENLHFHEWNRDVLVDKTLEYCFRADRKFEIAELHANKAQQKAWELRGFITRLQGDEETRVNPLPYRRHWGRR